MSVSEVLADEDEEICRAWALLAGEPPGAVRRLFSVLLGNGICLPDGTVAELAQKFIRKRAIDLLR